MITEDEFAKAVDSRSSKPIYEKMKAAHVGIAGLGGLGSNVAAALVRCGVGRLTLVDFDRVELSNINRQIYSLTDIGKLKTHALAKILHEINPFCEITTHDVMVDEQNAAQLFKTCEIVCEAFDGAQQKAMLVSTLLSLNGNVKVVSGSGMAGIGRANEIVTRKISGRLFVCGDGKTDVSHGDGLTAARVIVCAGHQASKIIELILEGE